MVAYTVLHTWAHLMHPTYDDTDEEEEEQLEMMVDDNDGGGGADGDDRIGGGLRTEDGDEDKEKHGGFALFS